MVSVFRENLQWVLLIIVVVYVKPDSLDRPLFLTPQHIARRHEED
jgi:hypothetical protein